ncbi:MAG: hypothetical protein MRY21_01235 [Simkaniaceae bacterium]|nr:hypothetical protein [Simkaniaceae bacterium]
MIKTKSILFLVLICLTASLRANEDDFKIVISSRQQECIYNIIKTMGTHSVFGLLKKKKKLQAMGDEIDNVPPLQFLGVIFTHEELPQYMPKIRSNVFKWSNLIGGLKKTLRSEYESGTLQPQLPAFSKAVGRSYDSLKARLDDGDFDGFVEALF